MKKFRRQFDNNYKGSIGEINNSPSCTIPDQSLNVKTLLLNHSRNLSSDIHVGEPQYFDTEIPIFQDLTEKMEYQQNLQTQLTEVKLQIKSDKKEAAASKKAAAIEQTKLDQIQYDKLHKIHGVKPTI
jgi:autotransporter translocation and assembly factor TamB